MKVTVKNNYLNLRVGEPLLNAPNLNYLSPGKSAEIDGRLYLGDSYDGSNIWLKDMSGNFIWSGGVDTSPVDMNQPAIPWWMRQLKLPEAWDTYQEKGARAKVAILDSGYNTANPEIVIADSSNFVGGTTTIADTFGHGSYCASLIGARNKRYLVGCAPECQLYMGKITEKGSLKSNRLIQGINWAIGLGVDILSISYGGSIDDPLVMNAIQNAADTHKIIVLAAIGDNLPPEGQAGGFYPALYDACIAIGATNQQRKLDPVTMVNDKTTINAPGNSIGSFLQTGTTPGQLGAGTSQATAIAAGICALMVSRFRAVNKPFTPDGIKTLLTTYYDPSADPTPQKIISPLTLLSQINNL